MERAPDVEVATLTGKTLLSALAAAGSAPAPLVSEATASNRQADVKMGRVRNLN
jgi:hypothetical protein